MEFKLNENGLYLPDDYQVFHKPEKQKWSMRQQDQYEQWTKFINWGRQNPVMFAERIFGVEFMDYQRYIFTASWNTPYVVWCCSRGSGKSILGSIFIMTKTLLIPQHKSYILCGVGSQSTELFTKIEKFVLRQIPSFLTLTDVYQGELVKSAANTNGFVHNPASFHFSLYNDSEVFTLNGNFDNNRSKRSNLNFYDEAAFVGNEELFTTSEPFCTQNNKFAMGVNTSEQEKQSIPLPFYNQLIYASSAGRTDQYFYKKYREASIHMDAGDKRYFCADINSDMVLKATSHGISLSDALLTQETIDSRMREDREAGLREYGNIFTSEGGDGQIIRRSDIIRNSMPMIPILSNENPDEFFGIAYDPARSHDNSVIGIGRYYKDSDGIWHMQVCNMISLVDFMKRNKTPMSTPNQIKTLKNIIADYVPHNCVAYDNLVGLLVDAGSGGAGVPITDFLCDNWQDQYEHNRKGLIDNEYNEGDDRRFPDAIKGKLQLVAPAKYKSEMYEAMIKVLDSNLVTFPEEYLNKGYVELIYEVDKAGKRRQRTCYPSEEESEKMKKTGITLETEKYYLSLDEEVALKQIDFCKTELVNMYRFKQSSGKDRFDLAPEKANKLHDDRAYVMALLCWKLACLNREPIINRRRPPVDKKRMFKIRAPKKVTRF